MGAVRLSKVARDSGVGGLKTWAGSRKRDWTCESARNSWRMGHSCRSPVVSDSANATSFQGLDR